MPGLRLGDVVLTHLVEALGEQEGVLEVGGRALRALFPEGLEVGQRLPLKVVALGPPLVLQRADSQGEAPAPAPRLPGATLGEAVRLLLAPRAAGPDAVPGQGPLPALRSLLQLPEDPAALAGALRAWVRAAAGQGEPEAASGLRALLRQVAGEQVGTPLARAADALLAHLDVHAARGQFEPAAVVPFLLPWGETGLQGELAVEEFVRGGGAGGRDASGALRIRLEMPHLGPAEVRLRWGEAGLSVRLEVAPRSLPLTQARVGELTEALTARAGLRVLGVRVDSGGPAPAGGTGLLEVLA